MPSRVVCLVVSVLIVVGGASAPLAQRRMDGVLLPPTVHVDPLLLATVEALLARSPTFRRQCAQIAEVPSLRIDVALVPRLLPSTVRARATAQRYEFGRLVVTIEIAVGGDYAELLAHELEHVTEQIDQVDLAALSRHDPASASALSDGAFETARARAAGRAAAHEVYGDVDPPVAAIGGFRRAVRKAWRRLGQIDAVAPDPRQFRRN